MNAPPPAPPRGLADTAAPPPQAVAPPTGAPPAPASGGAAAPAFPSPAPAGGLGGGPLGLAPANPEAATGPGTLMPAVGPGEGGGWEDGVGNNAGEAGGKQGPGGFLGNLSSALDLNSPSGQALFTTAMGLMSGEGKNFLDIAGRAGAGGLGVFSEAKRNQDLMELRKEQEAARKADDAWRRTVQLENYRRQDEAIAENKRRWEYATRHTEGREGVLDERAAAAAARAERGVVLSEQTGERNTELFKEGKKQRENIGREERQNYIDQLTAKLATLDDPTQINDTKNLIADLDEGVEMTRAEYKQRRIDANKRQTIKPAAGAGWEGTGEAPTGTVTGSDLAARKRSMGLGK